MMLSSVVFCFLTINMLIPWICASERYQVNFTEIRTVTSALFQNHTRPDMLVVKLNNCGIKSIAKDSLKNMTKLREFDVSRNEVEYLVVGIFQHSLELITINLSYNELKSLLNGVFAKLHKVVRLSLQKNMLATLGPAVFEDLVSLNYLELNNNQIRTLDAHIFSNNRGIRFLSVSNNYIRDLDKSIFQNITNLTKLYLTQNKISHIDRNLFSNLVNLRELSMSYNILQNIDSKCFLKTINLQMLWLAQNRLSSLDDNLFYFLINLEFLHLGNNLITHIGQHAFPRNSVLKEVYLGYNKIQYLYNETIDSLRTVTHLSLYKNSWICDCRLMNLYNIWKNHADYLIPKCAGPYNVQNISWDKLKSSDLLYCDNMKTNTTTNNTTMDMDNENNKYNKNNSNCDGFFVENIPFTCETRQDKFQGHYTNVQSKIYDNNTIHNSNKIMTNTDDEEIYKCQFTGWPTVEREFILKVTLNKSKMDNESIWKIVCIALVTFLVLIILSIIILLIVKKCKWNTPVYNIPDIPLETMEPENSFYDEVKSTTEIVAERSSSVYDELRLPENVVNLKVALYDELKKRRTASEDDDGYLKPNFINK